MRILEFQEGDENQPPIWNNEQYIPYFKRAKDCPVIDDFEVALVNWTFPDLEPEPNESPFSIYFYSKGRGLISGYEWNMKELCEDKFEIPLNYYDDDMGTLQIYTRKGFTHFEEGKYEKPEYFPTPWSQILWSNIPLGKFLKKFQLPMFDAFRSYKVPVERYISEWKLAIEACRNFS